MKGHFYAFESQATAAAVAPECFADGQLVSPHILRSTKGVWLAPATFGDPDPDTGARPVLDAGDLSAAFVILTPDPMPAAAEYEINPPSDQGFA